MEEDEVGEAKMRCRRVVERVNSIPSSTNITLSSKQTITKSALSELSYLSSPSPNTRSMNIGHLEALIHILHQPFISGVTRVSTRFPLLHTSTHVDLVCTVHNIPTWFIVSARNPDHLASDHTFSSRIPHLLAASSSSPPHLHPHSIVFFFSRGVHPALRRKMEYEFFAFPFTPLFSTPRHHSTDVHNYDPTNITATTYPLAAALEIKTEKRNPAVGIASSLGVSSTLPEFLEDAKFERVYISESFDNLLFEMKPPCSDLLLSETVINFDTTALVAVVSGISNGGWRRVVGEGREGDEMKKRFKGNVGFVVGQAENEGRGGGVHEELREGIRGKVGIVCESAKMEFLKLVEMYGGEGERWRSARLLKRLTGVLDSPSERVMGVRTSRRVGAKNKVVFGTADSWGAATLTSNSAFLRAVSQSGLALGFIRHEPRALIGD